MTPEQALKAQTDGVLAQERGWLEYHEADGPLSALCFSGGGIRSATFCLGVLQGLAQKGLLGRFHYLSTVSGGGYIGSWLQAWIARMRSVDRVVAELANVKSDEEPVPVRRLRAYTNYLSPVWGLSIDSLVLAATFLRNLLLNWIVLIPVMLGMVMLPRVELALVQAQPSGDFWTSAGRFALPIAILGLMVWSIAYAVADVPSREPTSPPPVNRFVRSCLMPLFAAAVLASWLLAWEAKWLVQLSILDIPTATLFFVVGATLHLVGDAMGVRWRARRGLRAIPTQRTDRLRVAGCGGLAGLAFLGYAHAVALNGAGPWFAATSVPALLGIVWLGSTMYALATSRRRDEEHREWCARGAAYGLGIALVWLLASVMVLFVPGWLLAWLDPKLALPGVATVSAGAVLAGGAASALGFWSKQGAKIREHTQTFLELTGMKLLTLTCLVVVLVLVLGMNVLASSLLLWSGKRLGTANFDQIAAAAADAASYTAVLQATPLALVAPLLAGLVLLGSLASHWVGINTFSLHSMYGNRLTRAYLGASNTKGQPHWFTGFDPADNVKMVRGAERKDGESRRLLHVVNAAVNMTKAEGSRLQWQQRKAAPFTMTPLHCGSAALGYVPTAQYGAEGGMSWARAMAISGAAASPSMGYHTSAPVAFLMALFNARLGWWTPNPRGSKHEHWQRREPRMGLAPYLTELIASISADHSFIHLSDGGHFENLGVYEMVRRKCTRILIVDATCDPDGDFNDLEGAIRKVRVDFGAVIKFSGPLPTAENAKSTGDYMIRGSIQYADGTQGEVVYIKPAVTGNEHEDVRRYAAANARKGRAFPHQPTSDQFFNESQFESYRMLGLHAVERHFSDKWDSWLLPRSVPAVASRSITTRAKKGEDVVTALRAMLGRAVGLPQDGSGGDRC